MYFFPLFVRSVHLITVLSVSFAMCHQMCIAITFNFQLWGTRTTFFSNPCQNPIWYMFYAHKYWFIRQKNPIICVRKCQKRCNRYISAAVRSSTSRPLLFLNLLELFAKLIHKLQIVRFHFPHIYIYMVHYKY